DLRSILAKDQPRAAVIAHVQALVGQVGRVDRHGHGPGREDAEVERHPLVAGVGHDADPIAGRDADGDQRLADALGVGPQLRPADLGVPALALDQRGGVLRTRAELLRDQVEHRSLVHREWTHATSRSDWHPIFLRAGYHGRGSMSTAGSALPDDFELLAAWRAGDDVAGNALVRRHFSSV